MKALEISGHAWQSFGFDHYQTLTWPEYDVCRAPLENANFDVIIAEHVWEHLLWPHRASQNVWQMLRPGGYFLVMTPFLVRIHEFPHDCSRWTEVGLKHLLAEAGFGMDDIVTGS